MGSFESRDSWLDLGRKHWTSSRDLQVTFLLHIGPETLLHI